MFPYAAWSGYGPMRGVFWIVVLVGLAALLDASLYRGFYTQAFARMFSDISHHMN
jgi:hypothetical protein